METENLRNKSDAKISEFTVYISVVREKYALSTANLLLGGLPGNGVVKITDPPNLSC